MKQVLMSLLALLFAGLAAGCQSEPGSWTGGVKFLNVHAVAFTPGGRGLLIVGPRKGGLSEANATAYYYVHLPTLTGRKLGYGQYALGQALICPFADTVAVPAYMPRPGSSVRVSGYELYDLPSGNYVRRVLIDNPEFFVASGPPPGAQPAKAEGPPGGPPGQAEPSVALGIWQRISSSPLTTRQQELARDWRPQWIGRDSPHDPFAKTEIIDGQKFYRLDSPDRKHRLYIRFRAPNNDPEKANTPAGEGYAYGYLQDVASGKYYMLFTTTSGDEKADAIGSAIVGGPVWLFSQPAKWFGAK